MAVLAPGRFFKKSVAPEVACVRLNPGTGLVVEAWSRLGPSFISLCSRGPNTCLSHPQSAAPVLPVYLDSFQEKPPQLCLLRGLARVHTAV